MRLFAAAVVNVDKDALELPLECERLTVFGYTFEKWQVLAEMLCFGRVLTVKFDLETILSKGCLKLQESLSRVICCKIGYTV